MIIKYSKVYIVSFGGRQVDLQFSYSQPCVNVVKEKIEPRQSSQSILQLGTNFHVNMEIKITLL